MAERISIDPRRYQVLEEPGLRPPGQRWTYTSDEVQGLIQASFGNMLPTICFDSGMRPYYEQLDPSGIETVSASRSITKREEVPRSEVIRLLEGVLALQKFAQDPSVTARLRDVAATFRLPHPSRERKSYRIYVDTEGYTRLHVLWGFGGKASERTTVPAAEAVAILLDTTVEELGAVVEEELTERLAMAWEPPKYEHTGMVAPPQTAPPHTAAVSPGRRPLFKKPAVLWGTAGFGLLLAIVLILNSGNPKPDAELKVRATEPEQTESLIEKAKRDMAENR